jgi:pimeloyl-ACP methyl ester carboxylesterase
VLWLAANNFPAQAAAARRLRLTERTEIQQRENPASKIIEGDWEGTLDVGAAKLRLVLHVIRKDDALTASLDSPDQGATALTIDTISFNEGVLRFEMKAYQAVYEGKLTKDNLQVEGEWRQGQAFPLVFKRAAPTEPSSMKLQKVDAGGHGLNLLIGGKRDGDKTPAVILEGGFGAGIASWTTVQAEIAKFAQVVSYDRAGLGQSEPGPKPRTAKQIALELHTALHSAGIKPPYILVGHSFGGPYIRVFAGMYPSEVAGLVLVDPSQEAFDEWNRARPEWKANEAKRKEEQAAQLAKATQGVRDESASVSASYEQARAAKVPPGIPVILLTAMLDPGTPPEMTRMWAEKHKEWIAKVPGGRLVLAEKSRHFIQTDEPQLVIEAIRQQVRPKPVAP